MILGDTCTRGCHFCNVKTGSPRGEVDWLEPKRVAEAVRDLGWKYLVLTAVDRDDLADGGAAIFAEHGARDPPASSRGEGRMPDGRLRRRPRRARRRPRRRARGARAQSRDRSSGCKATVRDKRAGFDAIAFDSRAREAQRQGALHEDVADARPGRDARMRSSETMDAARAAGVDIFTMGQYLQPTKRHLPVVEFVTPEKFDAPARGRRWQRASAKSSRARCRAPRTTRNRRSTELRLRGSR